MRGYLWRIVVSCPAAGLDAWLRLRNGIPIWAYPNIAAGHRIAARLDGFG
jgi:hypothetical protein